MQCPNCLSQVPNTANVCGHCGTNLQAIPKKKRFPGWIWGIIGGLAVLTLFVILGGIAYFLLFRRSAPSSPPPQQPQVITVIVTPTKLEQPAIEEVAQPAPQQPTATNTALPAPPPPEPVEVTQYCETFEAIDYSIVYLDWIPGAPLTFYVKMPGGVPGIEKKIPGVSEEWTYKVTIGDYETESCDIIQGYKERLYCSIELPSTYSNSIRSIKVEASSCDRVIFEEQVHYLPGIEDIGGGGGRSGNGGSGSSSPSCGDAPSGGPNGCTEEYISWCSCMGGSFVCGSGGPICVIP